MPRVGVGLAVSIRYIFSDISCHVHYEISFPDSILFRHSLLYVQAMGVFLLHILRNFLPVRFLVFSRVIVLIKFIRKKVLKSQEGFVMYFFAIISRSLFTFYSIFKDHFLVFKEVFPDNSVLREHPCIT